jgi:hypothetical protein
MNDPYAAFTNYLNSGVSYKNTNLLLVDAPEIKTIDKRAIDLEL